MQTVRIISDLFITSHMSIVMIVGSTRVCGKTSQTYQIFNERMPLRWTKLHSIPSPAPRNAGRSLPSGRVRANNSSIALRSLRAMSRRTPIIPKGSTTLFSALNLLFSIARSTVRHPLALGNILQRCKQASTAERSSTEAALPRSGNIDSSSRRRWRRRR